MQSIRRQVNIPEFTGSDGARVREVAGRSTGLVSHSLAVITHPAGTAARRHQHTVAEEVYYVSEGRGRLELDGEVYDLAPGDAAFIRPGQTHEIRNPGPGDLVLIVTCAPAYDVDEVTWLAVDD